MKALLVLPLVALAVGCGSGAGSTQTQTVTTTRIKTIAVHPEEDRSGILACQQANHMLLQTTGWGLDASQAYVRQNYPKGTSLVYKISHKLVAVRPFIRICRDS